MGEWTRKRIEALCQQDARLADWIFRKHMILDVSRLSGLDGIVNVETWALRGVLDKLAAVTLALDAANKLIGEAADETKVLQEELDAAKRACCHSDDDMRQPGETLAEVVLGIIRERDALDALLEECVPWLFTLSEDVQESGILSDADADALQAWLARVREARRIDGGSS